jgi:hypothetical protein
MGGREAITSVRDGWDDSGSGGRNVVLTRGRSSCMGLDRTERPSLRVGWLVPRDAQAKKCQNPMFGLPAPFGPRKPVTCPGRTVKLRSSTAATEPNRLLSRSTSITAVRP